MKIKADPLLFKAWTKLAVDMKMFSSIVQNDMDIPIESIYQWEKDAMAALVTFESLIAATKSQVLKGSPTEAKENYRTTTVKQESYLFPEDD